MTPERAKEIISKIETLSVVELAALGFAVEAIDKQIPKKPKIRITGTTDYNTEVKCPVCDSFVADTYCGKCGQKLESF